ncbi:MAG TPA: bifunctional DNA-formamidopyrimidine glycosylase/DNA-(apurinic or apyrimidinic site) lyase [Chloroflexota bacterium]|jgi:formamidopyrimidine-DNA glycosylase|nr:bifunctional DNA-formamidopyrimidine glycosylase/DNA-(apurinic or apyrimidinic site) lyase [Chloroflexota bacterium]
MPELPEVETVRGDLEAHLVGRTFTGAEVLWERSVDRPPAELFPAALAGHRVEAIERRGKFLVLRLDGGASLIVHLRMTGQLRWREHGAPRERHLRVVLYLDDGHELHFDDQRKFGRMYLVPDEAGRLEVLSRLGPEPLLQDFSREALQGRLRGRRARLKSLLMDQQFLAGLGNIYVDEALFHARLHPMRRSDTLTEEEITRLHEGITEALRQGIANRGTTLADYRDVWGTAGLNQEALFVFRREGQPCPRCGTPIEKINVGGRGTHFCPSCQPSPVTP